VAPGVEHGAGEANPFLTAGALFKLDHSFLAG
jgi:hypothetical protein